MCRAIKTFFKSIAVAFSIYSRIPMPRFDWGSDDMKYHLIFFPWVGAIIGGLGYIWVMISERLMVHDMTRVLVLIAIPLLVTGGFHVDGFMDTCDALKSYGDREKKLEILKDPHIGAFSVICLVTYLLVLIAGMGEIYGDAFIVLAIVPAMVRSVSAMVITAMKPAKKDGMLKASSDSAVPVIVLPVLILTFFACLTGMILADYRLTAAVMVAEILWFSYFYGMCMKQFGGVTGDLAGYYVTTSELVAVIVLAVMCVL